MTVGLQFEAVLVPVWKAAKAFVRAQRDPRRAILPAPRVDDRDVNARAWAEFKEALRQ